MPDVAGGRDVAPVDGRTRTLIHVDSTISTAGDGGVANRGVRTESEDDSVVGDVADLTAVDSAAGVLDDDAVLGTGDRDADSGEDGTVGNGERGGMAGAELAFLDPQHAADGDNRGIVPGLDHQPA